MTRFCRQCGKPDDSGYAFCRFCGKSFALPQPPSGAQPPVMPAGQQPVGLPPAPEHSTVRRGSKKTWAAFLAGLLLVVLISIGAAALWQKSNTDPAQDPVNPAAGSRRTTTGDSRSTPELLPFPADLLPAAESTLTCQVQTPEIIIPANYRSLEWIARLQCWTDQGTTEALISVEVPGFTQKFEQKITVSRLETEICIRPALLPDAIDRLHSSRDAQINITVTDLGSNRLIVQDTRPVHLYSRYDMQWVGQDGTPYYENILAWVTPEAEEIRQLLRLAADSCAELTNGQLDAIVGYQPVADWSAEYTTYVQVASIMHALSAKMDVKYVMAPFSATSMELQRVATPVQVINSAGGLCAETAVTLASAIQATNMHAVLILLPGHMQVAVETGYNSGDYFLVETTALAAAADRQFDAVIDYTMTSDDWFEYLGQEGVFAIDCDLADQLNIKPID